MWISGSASSKRPSKARKSFPNQCRAREYPGLRAMARRYSVSAPPQSHSKIERERLFGRGSGLGRGFRRIQETKFGEQAIRVRQAGVGNRGAIIGGGGLFETNHTLTQPARSPLVRVKAP